MRSDSHDQALEFRRAVAVIRRVTCWADRTLWRLWYHVQPHMTSPLSSARMAWPTKRPNNRGGEIATPGIDMAVRAARP